MGGLYVLAAQTQGDHAQLCALGEKVGFLHFGPPEGCRDLANTEQEPQLPHLQTMDQRVANCV